VTYGEVLALIEGNPLGVAAREIRGLFSTCETVHFVGLCIVFDLRMLGVIRGGSLQAALKYVHIAAFGLALNLASGIVLFSSEPVKYTTNPVFQIKMVLLLLAMINVVWFEVAERRKLVALGDSAVADLGAKAGAALSLILWVAILICGRWLPVTAVVQGG
jgi:hypothetical protein